ncbi:MAG: alpha-hydroxy-acid oxidizing protein [Burkholderiaceae bacterium]
MPAQLDKLLNAEDFRQAARRRLPKSIFEFIDGGAEDEITLRENRTAFERRRIARASSPTSPSRTCEPTSSAAPPPVLLIAPMGSCMLAWPEADIAIARAAAAHGIPYTLSTMSTTSIERMARSRWTARVVPALPVPPERVQRRADRARERAGYQAMVLTVDLQAGGKRERDLRNGVVLPLRLSLRRDRRGRHASTLGAVDAARGLAAVRERQWVSERGERGADDCGACGAEPGCGVSTGVGWRGFASYGRAS